MHAPERELRLGIASRGASPEPLSRPRVALCLPVAAPLAQPPHPVLRPGIALLRLLPQCRSCGRHLLRLRFGGGGGGEESTEARLRSGMAAGGGCGVPAHGLFPVAGQACAALLVHETHVVLRPGVALGRGPTEPVEREPVVGVGAAAFGVHEPQVEPRLAASKLGRPGELGHRPPLVPGHAATGRVEPAEPPPGLVAAPVVGRPGVQCGRFAEVIAGHAGPALLQQAAQS